ncbi:MAG: hypothetical protein S0880_08755 [Actinomycetota bacterium]|nr:hypothetical protein [Actinomycetota bacterium]
MLSSIHPLGERVKGNRYQVTAGAYVVGSTLGGTALGALAAVAGLAVHVLVPTGAALAIAAIVALGGAVADRTGLRLPCWRRQVDERWLDVYRGTVYGAGFGAQLGFGLVTIVTSASTYVAVAMAVLIGGPVSALVIGTTFGTVRGLVLLSGRRITGPESLRHFHRRLAEQAPAFDRATSVTMVLAGLALAGIAVAV